MKAKMKWCKIGSSRNRVEILALNIKDDDFNANLLECHEAMEEEVYPQLNVAGSSGCYFVRNKAGEKIAVFKPKNEEPYGDHNPKWPKYFQRCLCFCCFGRACLVPMNGYLSEVGASLVDERLQLHIVPKTRVVKMASPTFYYAKSCCTREEFHPKIGSYQIFVKNCKGAQDVLLEWSANGDHCPLSPEEQRRFTLLFQKMCVLDYVIRNTDRNMDNWLIKYVKNETLDLAAIDNGLSFPVKHPETASILRSFAFGWASLHWANKQWDESLRVQLLELLSPLFVHRLCKELRKLFMIDKDNNRFLIKNQLSVLRGQIWNLRLSLLDKESPSELIKRPLIVVTKKYNRRPQSSNWENCFKVKPADYTERGCIG